MKHQYKHKHKHEFKRNVEINILSGCNCQHGRITEESKSTRAKKKEKTKLCQTLPHNQKPYARGLHTHILEWKSLFLFTKKWVCSLEH